MHSVTKAVPVRYNNPMDNTPLQATDPALRASMGRRLQRRAVASGQIRLPAVPGMLDEYVTMCDTVFAGLGVQFTTDELAALRTILAGQLDDAYTASSRSNIVISYDFPVGKVLNYRVEAAPNTIEATYENWLATRTPPLFGTEPDARVWALAGEAADPRTHPVLDMGAGTGRNTLALARRSHPVDAVEMTPAFAETIRADAARGGLAVRVLQRNIFAAVNDLRWDYQLILLSEVLPDFRSTEQLRGLFELAAAHLAPGGRLVFNTFLPKSGYQPDAAVLELAQQCYSMIFTGAEMADAAAGLPLELVADDSVYDYERTHLPDGAWPPTSWYPEWISGQDVFDVDRDASPIEMRWLVYRKTC